MIISNRNLDLIETRAYHRLDLIQARVGILLEGERAEGAVISSPVIGAYGQDEGTQPIPEQPVVGE